jgi:endosialidase-like protein
MKGNKHMKTIISNIYPAFTLFALACLALSPTAQGVTPAPDGGYPGANTAEGQSAFLSLTTGGFNTAVGWLSLESLTTGSFNTGVGAGTLVLNTGDQNTATGTGALLFNTTGGSNTANGAFALFNNTTESFNTATGFQALFSNTGDGGHYNVATGYQALFTNTTGRRNTAEGNAALYSNTIGNFNVAVGDQALFSLATIDPTNGNGDGNTALGELAMVGLTTGGGNTGVGNSALVNSTSGYQNIAVGYVAGQNLTTGSNNIYLSNPAADTESNIIRIGNVVGFMDIYGFPHQAHTATYIAGINGATASGGVAVYVNSDGQLGTLTSSARFKDQIKSMDKTSEAILALKPVTFRYKKEIDPKGIPQFGLVAEEVEKVNPNLVSRDRDGKPYTVRYEAVNAMLLNEFLKEHRTVQELKSTVATHEATISQQKREFQAIAIQQQKEIEALTANLKEQASQIQKVSAQLELQKTSAQTVLNNQ